MDFQEAIEKFGIEPSLNPGPYMVVYRFMENEKIKEITTYCDDEELVSFIDSFCCATNAIAVEIYQFTGSWRWSNETVV